MESEKEACLAQRQKLHTTVFSQCFSPCGKYLAVCTNFGKIAIFNLTNALSPGANDESRTPAFTFTANSGAIYCLLSTDKFLISAGTGDITAWTWNDIITKSPKIAWSLAVNSEQKFDNAEVNSLALTNKEGGGNSLLAGCGDNNVHIWDLESGRQMTVLRGHTDYVHCIDQRSNGRECLSASEDGSVRLWDLRCSGEAMHVIEPYKNEECCRPELGKWLGCVSVDSGDDWMVCGGGPKLSLWHLRSMSATTMFDTPSVCQQFVTFHQEQIMSGGTQPYVNHWHLSGDVKAQVPCTPTSVFSLAINDKSENNKVLSIAGSSHKIDICTNFGYRAFSLSVC